MISEQVKQRRRAFALQQAKGLTPPRGFVFVVDDQGNMLTDADGAYIVEAI